MTDPRLLLDEIQARVTAATPGPWEVTDANEGMHEYGPMWMVTNDEFHNPSGADDEPWLAVEMHVGDKEDAEFIASARTDVPRLVSALRAVLDEHHPDRADGGQTCSRCGDWSDGYDVGGMFVAIEMAYPCPTVRAITDALAGES